MSQPAIEVSGLSKRYVIQHESQHDNLRDTMHHSARKLWRRLRWGTGFEKEDFWALQDVSFSIQPGEVVGIIGRNGAGKSTLLKILSRITEPTSGKVSIRGRVASLLEVGTGFHPELSGRENIFLNGAILGMRRAEIKGKFDEIVAFAEVEQFLDTPVKRYSSGMYVRLAFAVAAHLEPEILIVDEVLAVGDQQFQAKCLGKMNDVAHNDGRTVLFVSHRLDSIRELCTTGILFQNGRMIKQDSVESVLGEYIKTMAESPQCTRQDHILHIACPESVQHGDPFQVEVTVNVPPLTHAAHLRTTIYSESGEPIIGAGTHLSKDYSSPKSGETHTITLNIPNLPLSQGNYRINIALCDGASGSNILERLEHAIMFHVTGPSPYYRERWPEIGSLSLPQQWHHSRILRRK